MKPISNTTFFLYDVFIFSRIQSNINDEQKKEIEILHKRIGQVRNEYVNQISGRIFTHY